VADQIEAWRIQQYRDRIQRSLQYIGGKFRKAVTFDGGYTGKAARPVVEIGSTRARKITERKGDSPTMDVPMSGRWIYPVDYEWGDLIDDVDRVRLGIQPDGEFDKAGRNAMAIAEDTEIIASMFATAKTGEDGSTSTVFPVGNLVDQNTGGSNSGMNHEKIKAVIKFFMGKYVDIAMEQIWMVITEEEWFDLFGQNITVSADYASRGEGAINTGNLPSLYGVNFIPVAKAFLSEFGYYDGSHITTLPAWVKSGVHIGVWQDLVVKVGPDAAKKFNTRVYMRETFGATRLYENKVVKVLTYH
jgi:hypothetical protein